MVKPQDRNLPETMFWNYFFASNWEILIFHELLSECWEKYSLHYVFLCVCFRMTWYSSLSDVKITIFPSGKGWFFCRSYVLQPLFPGRVPQKRKMHLKPRAELLAKCCFSYLLYCCKLAHRVLGFRDECASLWSIWIPLGGAFFPKKPPMSEMGGWEKAAEDSLGPSKTAFSMRTWCRRWM